MGPKKSTEKSGDREKVRLPEDLSAQIAKEVIANQKIGDGGKIEGPTKTEIVERGLRFYFDFRKKHSKSYQEDRTIDGEQHEPKFTNLVESTGTELKNLLDAPRAGTSDVMRGIARYLLSMGLSMERLHQEVSSDRERTKQRAFNRNAQSDGDKTVANLSRKLEKDRGNEKSHPGHTGGAKRRAS